MLIPILSLILRCRLVTRRSMPGRARMSGCRDDRGQATSEYALVVLAAATLALLLVAWAAQSGKVGHLFDTVFDHVIGQVA
ncbi:MAG: DUF4244 domain-containing protein [Actinobacteria bacterium]|nr:DUF4244 domain-containing protein [Actinomycetota bacterium]